MDAVDSERSQEEMVPYSGLFPSSSYQLVPETHPSSIPSMYPFLSSSAEHFGSTGGVLEAPANSYGLYTSILRQESSHKVKVSLCTRAQYFLCWDFLGGLSTGRHALPV